MIRSLTNKGKPMKRAIIFPIIIMLNTNQYLFANSKDVPVDLYGIQVETKWENIEQNEEKIKQFGSKWLLVGGITFKKKSKDSVNLSKLSLRWRGPKLCNITGSLYKKNPDRPFLAIEDQLLCDGIWNKTKQTLIFNFNEEQSLGPLNIFYVTLTVPAEIEALVKNGSFALDATGLPTPYRRRARNTQLVLAFDTLEIEQTKPLSIAANRLNA